MYTNAKLVEFVEISNQLHQTIISAYGSPKSCNKYYTSTEQHWYKSTVQILPVASSKTRSCK